MSSRREMFAALDARNEAQASPDDRWVPMPWCEVGVARTTVGTYYTLPRLDCRLVGRTHGPCGAETDGTLIVCSEEVGGWQFWLSGTPLDTPLAPRLWGFNDTETPSGA